MRSWVERFTRELPPGDRERLNVLMQLLEVSSHDLSIRPGLGAISVEIFDSRSSIGNEAIGNPIYQHDFGSPAARM
jgi:hypothetical protein